MKTLIIHPEDPSTDFLSKVYENKNNFTLVTKNVSKSDVLYLISEHDRVIMMGHGSSFGLFSMNNFNDCGSYIIDYTCVSLLREKKENVFIWCYASDFVSKYKLNGFSTGMFISEIPEAIFCGIKKPKEKDLIESNSVFVNLLNENFEKNYNLIYDNIDSVYGSLSHNNIANYNHRRLRKF